MSSLAITKNDVTFSKTRSIVTDRVTAKYAFSLAFWQMLRCYATAPPATPSTFLETFYEIIFVESSGLLEGVEGEQIPIVRKSNTPMLENRTSQC